MDTKKKRLLNLVVTLLCLVMTVPTATALRGEADISPQYLVVDIFATSCTIDSNGRSTCTGDSALDPNYSIELTMELQQKKNGSWGTIKTWTDSGSDVSLTKNWYVDSGYYYRVKLSGVVTNSRGQVIESPVNYSSTRYY